MSTLLLSKKWCDYFYKPYVAVETDAKWIDPCNHMNSTAFRKQMAYFARNRHVVSMDELVGSLINGQSLPAKSVVIALDDGYRDTLTVAAPILAEYKLPALIYLVTGYISRTENQCVDQLYSIFAQRTINQLYLSLEDKHHELDSISRVKTVYHTIAKKLVSASYE